VSNIISDEEACAICPPRLLLNLHVDHMTLLDLRGWLFEYYTFTENSAEYNKINDRVAISMNFIHTACTENVLEYRRNLQLRREHCQNASQRL